MKCKRLVSVLAAVLLLHGCAVPEVKDVPPPEPAKPEAKEVVILVSENIPDYSLVAKALASQLKGRGSIRYLKGSRAENIKMLAGYQDDKEHQFVSIGLAASVAAKQLENSQVVFCQVFNYQDYDLVTPKHKGVSMMPAMRSMFGLWKALSPDVTDVGVISGAGMEDVIQEASAAARSVGITLQSNIVSSDVEYQNAYKQMADKVQGYWLLPDNRVLSGNVLKDLMTFSVREGKQVVVPSKELLGLGGLFSASADHQEIARQVVGRLDQAQDKDMIPGADIIYPARFSPSINSTMVDRFNLKVPAQYKKFEHAY